MYYFFRTRIDRGGLAQVCADLSVQNDLPVYKSQLFKDYSSIDSRFRPLIMLVKAWAKARGINSAPQVLLFYYSQA